MSLIAIMMHRRLRDRNTSILSSPIQQPVESTTIFLLASPATCDTCAVGTFHSAAVYPYRPRNFLPTQVRNSRPRGGAHAHSCHHFSSWLRRTARRQGKRSGIRGLVFSKRAGRKGEMDERCEVRQVRVPYFPQSRGLVECRVSLAEAPETASRGWVQMAE